MARSHSDDETVFLDELKVDRVFMGEHELASGMARHVIERLTAGAKSARDRGKDGQQLGR